MDQKLNNLRRELSQVEELLKYANCYGSISVGDIKVTKEELNKIRTNIKAQIAAIYSRQNLRLIK